MSITEDQARKLRDEHFVSTRDVAITLLETQMRHMAETLKMNEADLLKAIQQRYAARMAEMDIPF